MTTPSINVDVISVNTELSRPASNIFPMSDRAVQRLAGDLQFDYTNEVTYDTLGTFYYQVPDYVNQIEVYYPTSSGTGEKRIDVSPGELITVVMADGSAQNTVRGLNIPKWSGVVANWAGNVDHENYVTIQLATTLGQAWSASGSSGTLYTAAQAKGAWYSESGETNHGDLGATVSVSPLSTTSLVSGSSILMQMTATGRYGVTINTQPTALNAYKAIIFLYDYYGGEGGYTFTLSAVACKPITIKSIIPTVQFADLSNKTWVKNLAGSQSAAGCYSGQSGFSVDRWSDGYVYLTMGVWPTDPPNCQTCDWSWLKIGGRGSNGASNNSTSNIYRQANNIRPYWTGVSTLNLSTMDTGDVASVQMPNWPYTQQPYTYYVTKTSSHSISIQSFYTAWNTGDTGSSISISSWWNNFQALGGGTADSYGNYTIGTVTYNWTDLGY